MGFGSPENSATLSNTLYAERGYELFLKTEHNIVYNKSKIDFVSDFNFQTSSFYG